MSVLDRSSAQYTSAVLRQYIIIQRVPASSLLRVVVPYTYITFIHARITDNATLVECVRIIYLHIINNTYDIERVRYRFHVQCSAVRTTMNNKIIIIPPPSRGKRRKPFKYCYRCETPDDSVM